MSANPTRVDWAATTADPGSPLHSSGGVILEVNAPPNFYYHYHKKDGPFPVAVHVLRRLLTERPGVPAGVGAGIGDEGRIA